MAERYKVIGKLFNGDDLLLLNTEDIFIPGKPPTVVTGGSGSGKTVIVADIPRALSSKLTGLYMLSNSYDTSQNAFLRKKISKTHVHGYTIEKLNDILKDIYERSINHAKYTEPKMVQDFIKKNVSGDRLVKLNGMINELNTELDRERHNYDDDEAFETARELFEHNMLIGYIAKSFHVDTTRDQVYTRTHEMVINYCSSTPPMPILIVDDVTSSMKNPSSGTYRIVQLIDGDIKTSVEKGVKAQKLLMSQIFTTIRHHGMSAFFVHSYDAIPVDSRNNVNNLVLLDESSIDQLGRAKAGGITKLDKELIKDAYGIGKEYNKYCHVFFCKDPSGMPHKQKVALYMANFDQKYVPFGTTNTRRFYEEYERRSEALRDKKMNDESRNLDSVRREKLIHENAVKGREIGARKIGRPGARF